MKKSDKKMLIIIVFLFLIAGALVTFCLSTGFTGTSEVTINVFEKYKSEVKATLFFRDITDSLTIENAPNTSVVGDYEVIYSYKILGLKKEKKVVVHVVDKEPPTIVLNGLDKQEVFLNDEYEEAGYEVSDNYDSNVKVEIDGEIDTSEIGNYYLTYRATDTSNNKTEVVRKVVVSRVSPLAMSLKEFNINEYFPEIILKENNSDKDYLNKIVLAGDSVIWKFGTFGVFSSSRVWAKPCEGVFNFNTQKIVYKNEQSDYTLADQIKRKQPEYLYLHMGVCDCNNDDPEAFAKAYAKVIDSIKELSPNTKLVVMSLVPQTKESLSWIPKRNNLIINKYNYYLANVCKEKEIPFLNVAEVLKNSEGLGNQTLYFDDGYHPNVTGMKKILEYINNHQL